MYEDLHPKQIEILEFIKKKIRTRGYPPSVREIGQAVGLSSTSTVHNHLNKLEKKGYIRRDPSKPRAIEIVDENDPLCRKKTINVPVVGRVAAGEPVLAAENIEDTFPLPLDFIRSDDVFILTVRGDSMIEAGIMDGDYVIVRQQSTARNGDIVVALLGDEATVKTYYRENDHIRLQPENSRLEPIITRDVKILGKVIGLFRRIP